MRPTSRFTKRLLWRALALGALLAAPASAQRDHDDNGDSARRHVRKCRVAARVVAMGVPLKAQSAAHEFIVTCNDQAPAALAAALRRLATSADTSALRPLLTGAAYVRDTGFFNAALDVASRTSATNEARAVALLVAAMELTDRVDFDLHEVAATTTWLVCQQRIYDHSLRTSAGTALASDASARLSTVASAMLSRTATPRLVANAARCALSVTVPPLPPDSVPTEYGDSTSWVSGAPHLAATILRDILVLQFRPGTLPADRAAAVALVNGTVVGGRRRHDGDGLYLVRVPVDGTIEPLFRAIAQLRQLPQVLNADAEVLFDAQPNDRRSHSVPGAGKSLWKPAVPALPPDSIPAEYADTTMWVSGGTHLAGTVLRDIIVLGFKRGTPQSDRAAAVALVNGTVVGGRRRQDGDGLYLIRVPTDGTVGPLFRAIGQLRQLPQVSTALADFIIASDQSNDVRGEDKNSPRATVPAVPPDSQPAEYNDTTMWVSGSPHIAGALPRDIIVLEFQPGATPAERAAAVALVNGTVVGGRRRQDGDGLYLVRVRVEGTIEPLFRAIAQLRALPQVALAFPELIMAADPTDRRPDDSAPGTED